MRFVIYGAGAIGGVVGGRLFEAGQEVVLIARGEHAQVMRRDGLRLTSPSGSVLLPIPVAEHPREIDWREGDVILLAVKSQDTIDAVSALARLVPEQTAIVSMQNGVSNEAALSRWFDRVYACCVMCPAEHLEPGQVTAFAAPTSGVFDLGRFPGRVDDTAREIAAALAASTFESEARADIMSWKYRKLVVNLGNAVQALCGEVQEGSELIRLLEEEAFRCFEAAGIAVVTEAEDVARRADHLKGGPIPGHQRRGGSTWQSMQRGTGSLETDYLNGEIALLGRRHQIPTPANVLVQDVARLHAAERRLPGAITEAELLRRLELLGASESAARGCTQE